MNRPRRGYMIIELLLVISALLIIMGLSVGLIQVLMRLDRAARSHLAEATTRDRLVRRFRIDVRSASKAEVKAKAKARTKAAPGDANASDRLELTGPDGRVVSYLAGDARIVRDELEGKTVVRHESYRLRSGAVPRFEVRDEQGSRFVVLGLAQPPMPPGEGPPREAEYLGLLGRDARLARGKEAGR